MKTCFWVAGGFALLIVMASAPAATAHKGKLPPDALTLVRQASALLAQSPGMSGEVKERLQAALQSKRPEGVDRQKVAAAIARLDRRDVPGARRLLLAAVSPPGMPMPPQGMSPTVPAPSAPSKAQTSAAQPPAPQSMETAMRMSEPLRARFGGTSGEVMLLVVAGVLVAAGLLSLWAGREGASA